VTETLVGGIRYYVCFKDDYSKYRPVFFITTKSEVVDYLRKVLKEVKTGHFTKALLSDGIQLWVEACNTAVYILKLTLPTPVESNMHLQLWTG
jgi:hypothetical protein